MLFFTDSNNFSAFSLNFKIKLKKFQSPLTKNGPFFFFFDYVIFKGMSLINCKFLLKSTFCYNWLTIEIHNIFTLFWILNVPC